MPKLLLLLSCWFIASDSICQAPPAGFPDTPTITENSVGKAQIGMSINELKGLYKGCTFGVVSTTQYTGIKEKRLRLTGLCVKCRGKELFAVDTWGSNRKVRNIIVLAARYKTVAGIHIGSTARSLKKALPELKVARARWNHNLQIAANEEYWLPISYWFKDAGNVGNYKEANPANETEENEVPLVDSSDVISMIVIYARPL